VRVIGGSARGRRLVAPPGRDVRPTSDRVREAMFSSLAEVVPGASVLDLYAGSGALSVEALSRGAAAALLVERDARAVAAATRNLELAGVADRGRLRRGDAAAAARAAAALPGAPFDLVLVDPPYAEPLGAVYELLAALAAGGGLAAGAVVVVERDRRDPDLDVPPPAGMLALDRRRTYGDTVLLYLHAVPPEVEEPSA
jgi:16S rRNA (guanine966-N2)-methyltransferase